MCTLLVFAYAFQAVADEPASAGQSADVARLEALLAAQQQRIDALQQQVAGRAQETDAARVEAMKQQIREILGESEFRESLMPATLQAGYDNGFFIRSSDQKFAMLVNGCMQFRWQYYATRSRNRYLLPRVERDDRSGFDLTRLRLDFSGHAYSEDLSYFLELEADAADGYDSVLGEAWIDYRFADALHVKAGLFKGASTRANLVYNTATQFVDRPVFDAVFGLGFGVGVRFWGELADGHVDYMLDVLNSMGSGEDFAIGRTITPDPAELDGNPAILFRTVWHALASEEGDDFVDEADLQFHESPALDFGFHYAFNDDAYDQATTRIPFALPDRSISQGGFGLTTTNGLQINQFGLDAAFKYCGFSATSEYVLRIVDPRRAGRQPFASWWLATRQGDTTVQHGAYAQLGYFLPIPGLEKKLEAVARVGGISTLANGQEGTWEYAAGLNYYIEGNNVKLQTDVTRVSEAPISNPYSGLANVNDDVLLFRVQLQLAF